MCCGQDEGPRAAAVTTEEPMAKVYTAVPGAVLSIGGFGIASNEQAAEVPESVAAELAGRDDLVIVRSGPSGDFAGHRWLGAPQPLASPEVVIPAGNYTDSSELQAAVDEALAATEHGADFVIPEDNPPATPAKRARKAQES